MCRYTTWFTVLVVTYLSTTTTVIGFSVGGGILQCYTSQATCQQQCTYFSCYLVDQCNTSANNFICAPQIYWIILGLMAITALLITIFFLCCCVCQCCLCARCMNKRKHRRQTPKIVNAPPQAQPPPPPPIAATMAPPIAPTMAPHPLPPPLQSAIELLPPPIATAPTSTIEEQYRQHGRLPKLEHNIDNAPTIDADELLAPAENHHQNHHQDHHHDD